MKITKNYIECRDPMSHRTQCFAKADVNKKETRRWEKKYQIIMRDNVYLVWTGNRNTLFRAYRVCSKDFKTLKEMEII